MRAFSCLFSLRIGKCQIHQKEQEIKITSHNVCYASFLILHVLHVAFC